MRHFTQVLGIVFAVFAFAACNEQGGGVPSTSNVTLSTIEDTLAYGFGMLTAQSMTDQLGIEDPNLAALNKGIADQLNSPDNLIIDGPQFNMIAQNYMKQQAAVASEENVAKGKAFLEENATKDGVMTTDTGLQYKIIEEGEGTSPTATDQVTVHYEGTLINGKKFDSSYDRGEPVTFPVSGVIAGWTEALQMMKPGSKWQLFIPSNLGYGPQGAGADIGPNETLIFDVELISVNDAG